MINKFVEKLKERFAERLISVGLHNVGVTSFLNKNGVFIVLNEVNPDDLFSIKAIYSKFKKHFSTPMVVDKNYFKRTSDIFCMELLEMKENAEIVYGDNILNSIEISTEDLKKHIKYELYSKLLILRGAFIDLPLDRKVVDSITYRSMYNFLLIMRNILRIKGKLINDHTIIEKFEDEFKINLEAFKTLRDSGKIPFNKLLEIFKKYLEELDEIVKTLDKIGV